MALLLAACGGESLVAPGDAGTRQIGGFDRSLEDIQPVAYLGEVGCSVQEGPRDSSTVAVKRLGGGFVRFACAAVDADSIKAAIARYRAAGIAALGGASAQSGDPGDEGGEGGLVYLYATYSCDLTHVWELDHSDGRYYYLWTTGECTFLEHYWDPNVGGPSPSTTPTTDSTGTWEEYLPCNQLVNPECHQPLSVEDNLRIDASFQYFRDTTAAWPDTLARRQCIVLMDSLRYLRTLPPPGGVFRGLNSTPAPGAKPHHGQGYQGAYKFHFDPPRLNDATSPSGLKNLLITALHETAHAVGLADHPDTDIQYGSLPYFKYTDLTGPNSCVVP